MDKVENPQRLCSEIQLFDLCDRDDCQFKKGRFCANQDILARFEAISDDEDANSTEQFLVDEMDEMEEDGLEYDEGVAFNEEDEPEEEE
jgi:hypothetical protein